MPRYYEITVGPGSATLAGDTNEVIQAAIDRVAALGGGIVNILPGTYLMHDSLHLKSKVTIHGQGCGTILRKAPCVSSPTINYLGYGHFDVSVAQPEKFEPGMGIYITDDNAPGFYGTVAAVTRRDGHILGITKPLNHDIDCSVNGRAVTVFPVISGYYLEDCCIENLLVDGNSQENEYLNGCRGGGIFLLQAHNAIIRNVVVRNYNGDGISFQQCKNTLIENCLCTENKGHGLHPGSGSVGPVIRNSTTSGNGDDGIYYCLRVSHSLCEGCTITDNGHDGISIGHRDNDIIIRENTIRSNERHGIYLRRDPSGQTGHRCLISGNRFEENCRTGGNGEIMLDSPAKDFHITGNSFKLINTNKEENYAVSIAAEPVALVIHGNNLENGNIADLPGGFAREGLSFSSPTECLKTGPDTVTDNSSLHLG